MTEVVNLASPWLWGFIALEWVAMLAALVHDKTKELYR